MSTASIKTSQASDRFGIWLLQISVAAGFFVAGAANLGAEPNTVRLFAQIGLGQWLRVITGVVEMIGAFALVFPRLAAVGGLWLGATMFSAALICLFDLHADPTPALALTLLSALIVYLRRDELVSLAHTFKNAK